MDIITIVFLSILCIWLLFSYPAFSLSLLLMVPLVKAIAIIHVPLFRVVDLTVLVNVVVGVLGVWSYIKSRNINSKLYIPWSLFFSLLVIVFLFSLGMSWTTAPNYGSLKLLYLVGIGLPFLILPSLFIRSIEDANRTLSIFIIVSVFVSIVLIFSPQSALEVERYGSNFGRKTFFGSDPNTPAVVILVGMLVALMGVIAGNAKKGMKTLSLILLPLGLAGILVSGSRANLLGFIVGFLFIPFINRGKSDRSGSNNGKIMFIGIVGVSLLLLIVFILPSLEGQIPLERWFKFTEQLSEGDLTSTRTPAWIYIMNSAWDEYVVFGHGPGSYAYDYLKEDAPLWPHNIVLEALYEAGVIGFVAMIAFYIICLKTALKGMRAATTPADRFLVAAPSAIVLSMMVTSLTHWSLENSRYLFLFAGVLFNCVVQVVNRNSDNNSHIEVKPENDLNVVTENSGKGFESVRLK